MHAHHSAEQTLGHPVGGLVAVRLFCIEVFVGHVKRFGPLVAIVVAGGNLQGSSVRHDGVNADGVPCTRERVPDRSLGFDDGQAQVVHDAVHDVEVLLDLPRGVRFVSVCGVGFKEVNLPHPDEGTGLFGFVTEGVDRLVNLQREVFVGPNPQRKHRVHGSFRGWTEEHRHVQVVLTGVLDPVNFLLEAAFFLFVTQIVGVHPLLSGSLQSSDEGIFLFEEMLGDEQGEIHFLVIGAFHLCVGQAVDEFHRLPAVGPPHVHALDGVPLVNQLRRFNDEGVPLVEVLRFGRNASLRFAVAHDLA